MANKKPAAPVEQPKLEGSNVNGDAPAERELPTVIRDLVFNFDEFVGYGKAMQSHLSDTGMPWSFAFFGINVTHENDDCYILPEGKFNRGDALRVQIVHRGAEIESVTLGITTTGQTGDFDNELKYLDKAMSTQRVTSPGTLIDGGSYSGVYEDHNHVCVRTLVHDNIPPGHRYDIGNHDVGTLLEIEFQKGPIKEVGVNGVQNEHLLALLIHRTQVLNDQFPCDENVLAIRHMKLAINALQARTANRQARGVEGQNKL